MKAGMTHQKRQSIGQSPSLDRFRLIAAILVIAIHTAPLADLWPAGDFWLTRCLARIAVPFFFMTTGYFLMPRPGSFSPRSFLRRAGKLGRIYVVAILLYLPLNIYSGQLELSHPIRWLIFDGTFYHLWYLPAAILGLAIIFAVAWIFLKCAVLAKNREAAPAPKRRKTAAPPRRRGPAAAKHPAPTAARQASAVCLAVGLLLYIPGLLGDSYYGLTEGIPALKSLYSCIFNISSYTRNGIFFAPVFISLGWFIREHPLRRKKSFRSLRKGYGSAALLLLGVMSLEALTLHKLSWQRHDSMYLLLPPLMYTLFHWLLAFGPPGFKRRNPRTVRPVEGSFASEGHRPHPEQCKTRWSTRRPPAGRHRFYADISLYIYLLHPWVIVLIRGAAKVTQLEWLLVQPSLIHFMAVTLLSCLLSVILWKIKQPLSTAASVGKLTKRP